MLSNLVRQELARQYQTLKNAQPKTEFRQLPVSSTALVTTIVATVVLPKVDEQCAADATSALQVSHFTVSNTASPISPSPMSAALEPVQVKVDVISGLELSDTSRVNNEVKHVDVGFKHVETVPDRITSSTLVVPTESPSLTCVVASGDSEKTSIVTVELCGETTESASETNNDTSMIPDADRQLTVLESTSTRHQFEASCPPTVNHCLKRDCGDCHDECVNNDFFTAELNDINTGCVMLIRTKNNNSSCYSFKCTTFETPMSFRTSSVSLTRGSLRENQFSIRSSVKLVKDQHGRPVKNMVIRGPVYHITDPSISFEAGRLLVMSHASRVLFRIYVKLISKCRLLMFEFHDGPTTQTIPLARDEVGNTGGASGSLIVGNTPAINYIGRHFDHLCADFKDKVIRNQSTLAPLIDCVKIAISNLLANAHNTFKDIVAELKIGDSCLTELPEVSTVRDLIEPCNAKQEQGVVQNVDVERTLSDDVFSCEFGTSVGSTVSTFSKKKGKRSREKSNERTFKTIFDLSDGESLLNEHGDEADEAGEMMGDESRFEKASDDDLTLGATLSPKVVTQRSKRKVREKAAGATTRKPSLKKAKFTDGTVLPTNNDICFICCEVAADILFPCGKHSGCQRCVRQCWKADLSKQSAFGVKCPFCRGIGSVLVNKDTLKEFTMPPYRLRTTANINYMEADDSSNSDDAITCASKI